MQGRQKEWARWKYFVMARSQKEYLALRQLFSGNQWSEEKTTVLSTPKYRTKSAD